MYGSTRLVRFHIFTFVHSLGRSPFQPYHPMNANFFWLKSKTTRSKVVVNGRLKKGKNFRIAIQLLVWARQAVKVWHWARNRFLGKVSKSAISRYQQFFLGFIMISQIHLAYVEISNSPIFESCFSEPFSSRNVMSTSIFPH